MTPQRIPASEWRQLTADQRRQAIRDGHVPYDQLDPTMKALVDQMIQEARK